MPHHHLGPTPLKTPPEPGRSQNRREKLAAGRTEASSPPPSASIHQIPALTLAVPFVAAPLTPSHRLPRPAPCPPRRSHTTKSPGAPVPAACRAAHPSLPVAGEGRGHTHTRHGRQPGSAVPMPSSSSEPGFTPRKNGGCQWAPNLSPQPPPRRRRHRTRRDKENGAKKDTHTREEGGEEKRAAAHGDQDCITASRRQKINLFPVHLSPPARDENPAINIATG